jgi:hypothetical protein
VVQADQLQLQQVQLVLQVLPTLVAAAEAADIVVPILLVPVAVLADPV